MVQPIYKYGSAKYRMLQLNRAAASDKVSQGFTQSNQAYDAYPECESQSCKLSQWLYLQTSLPSLLHSHQADQARRRVAGCSQL